MTVTARMLMVAGGLLLAALIMLRVFSPDHLVGHGIGAALAIAWPFACGVGIMWEKNVSIGGWGSPWRALLVITSLFIGVTTDFALGIGVLYSPKSEVPLPLTLFIALIAMVCAVGWWRLLR